MVKILGLALISLILCMACVSASHNSAMNPFGFGKGSGATGWLGVTHNAVKPTSVNFCGWHVRPVSGKLVENVWISRHGVKVCDFPPGNDKVSIVRNTTIVVVSPVVPEPEPVEETPENTCRD